MSKVLEDKIRSLLATIAKSGITIDQKVVFDLRMSLNRDDGCCHLCGDRPPALEPDSEHLHAVVLSRPIRLCRSCHNNDFDRIPTGVEVSILPREEWEALRAVRSVLTE